MTTRPLRPPTGSGASFGLEAWLIGSPAELDAALTALASVGRVACHGIGRPGTREPLTGADYGRYRTYALTHIHTRPAGCGNDPAATAAVRDEVGTEHAGRPTCRPLPAPVTERRCAP